MKTKVLTRLLAVAFLGPALASAPFEPQARSQVARAIDPNTGLPVPVEELSFPTEVEDVRLERVDFEDLPLADVVQMLREKFPSINFVVPRLAATENKEPIDLDGVSVRLKMRDVGLRDVLTGIAYATDHQLEWKQAGERLVVFQPGSKDQSGPVHMVGAMAGVLTAPPPPAPPPSRAEYEVVNLPEVLHTANPDEIKKALEEIMKVVEITAAELGGAGPQNRIEPPRLRYHDGSGLLVVVGSREGISLAMRMIQKIQNTVVMKAGAFSPSPDKAKDPHGPSLEDPLQPVSPEKVENKR